MLAQPDDSAGAARAGSSGSRSGAPEEGWRTAQDVGRPQLAGQQGHAVDLLGVENQDQRIGCRPTGEVQILQPGANPTSQIDEHDGTNPRSVEQDPGEIVRRTGLHHAAPTRPRAGAEVAWPRCQAVRESPGPGFPTALSPASQCSACRSGDTTSTLSIRARSGEGRAWTSFGVRLSRRIKGG